MNKTFFFRETIFFVIKVQQKKKLFFKNNLLKTFICGKKIFTKKKFNKNIFHKKIKEHRAEIKNRKKIIPILILSNYRY